MIVYGGSAWVTTIHHAIPWVGGGGGVGDGGVTRVFSNKYFQIFFMK